MTLGEKKAERCDSRGDDGHVRNCIGMDAVPYAKIDGGAGSLAKGACDRATGGGLIGGHPRSYS
jgi:hypothetical protein